MNGKRKIGTCVNEIKQGVWEITSAEEKKEIINYHDGKETGITQKLEKDVLVEVGKFEG